MLQAARKLVEADNKITPVSDKYRLWIDRVRFFYPDIQKVGDDNMLAMRTRLIEAFNVIDKYGSRLGTLDDQMQNFVYVMMSVIGENRFNSIQRNLYNLQKSERYADIIATRYVFTHHKFQDIIYTLRPFTDATKKDLRDRFEYFFKSEYKQAITEEIQRLETEKSKIEEYNNVESELNDMSDKLDVKDYKFLKSHTKEECHQILNQLEQLKKRKRAKKAVNKFKEEHQFTSNLESLGRDFIDKYKDLLDKYFSLSQPPRKALQTIEAVIEEKLKPHLQEKHDNEQELLNIIDRVATTTKQQEEFRDEITYLDVADWIQKHRYNERAQINLVKRKLDALANYERVVLTDMNKESREQFSNGVGEVLGKIANDLPVHSNIYVEYGSKELGGGDVRKYTRESFITLIREWLKEGFVIKYMDGFDSFYMANDGSTKTRPKIWSLDSLQIHLTDPREHAPGGNFCPYILLSDDPELIKYCREKIQLADHIPRSDESDLLEPCLIHAICESAKTVYDKPLSKRQVQNLRNSLWSRCLTRFIPLASIASLAREFSLRVIVYDIEEHPLNKFSSHGITYGYKDG